MQSHLTVVEMVHTGISDERRVHVHACDIISDLSFTMTPIDAIATHCRRAPSSRLMASWRLALDDFVGGMMELESYECSWMMLESIHGWTQPIGGRRIRAKWDRSAKRAEACLRGLLNSETRVSRWC